MVPKYAEVIEGSQSYALQVIKVTFPFNFDDLDKVKTLLERRFFSNGKYWTCKVDLGNAEKLKSWGFTLSQSLEDMLRTRDAAVGGTNVITAKTVKAIEVPGLKHELFSFQKIGVSFIEEKNGRALVADEMGLGKTVQALAWLQLHPELRPAIVVVPASLKLNWKREAENWMPSPKVEILSGTKPWKTYGEIIVINYDILSAWVANLKSLVPKVLIMDEIHYAKSSATKRTKAVKQLAKGIFHVIGLSGTPIVNRPIEAYNALTIINSAAIPNFKVFTTRYCGAKYNGFGWDFTGASNTQELHQLLVHAFMIRRKKSDVLKDLPDKIKSFVPMELSNQKEYDSAEADFISYVKDKAEKQFDSDKIKTEEKLKAELGSFMEKYGIEAYQFGNHTLSVEEAKKAFVNKKVNSVSGAEVLVKIEGLKQLAVVGKMDQVMDWIEDFLETDQKLVVFAVHKFAIDALMSKFGKLAVKVDGSVSMQARQEAVDKFQDNPQCRLFVGNIQAAGVGLTLTAASNVAFIELPWTSSAVSQSSDRVHRIGQKDSVTIHFLLAANSIEEKIALLLDRKQVVLDAVLDGEATQQQSLLSELMKEYL